MKRILSIVICAFVCFTFCGCRKINQADELILIQAIAVDKVAEGYQLTMQTYDTTDSEGKALSSAVSKNIKNVVTTAKTIYMALKSAETMQGEKAFTGHNVMIVLGENVINEDITKVLDFFVNDAETYPGISVVCCNGKASDILQIENDDEKMSAIVMQEILKRGINNSEVVSTDIIRLTDDILKTRNATCIPQVKIYGKDGIMSFVPDGSSIIKKGIRVGSLDSDETTGFNILNNKAQTINTDVGDEGEKVSVFIDKIRTKVRPQIVDGKVVMDVKIKYEIRQTENQSQFSPQYLIDKVKLRDMVDTKIDDMCARCIDKSLYQVNADVLGVEDNLKFYKMDYYKYAEIDFDNVLKNVSYKIEIDSNVVG